MWKSRSTSYFLGFQSLIRSCQVFSLSKWTFYRFHRFVFWLSNGWSAFKTSMIEAESEENLTHWIVSDLSPQFQATTLLMLIESLINPDLITAKGKAHPPRSIEKQVAILILFYAFSGQLIFIWFYWLAFSLHSAASLGDDPTG